MPAYRTPTITQLNPGLCPVECAIRDASSSQASVPSVTKVTNSYLGTVEVMTGLKTFSGKEYVYELKCTSTLS